MVLLGTAISLLSGNASDKLQGGWTEDGGEDRQTETVSQVEIRKCGENSKISVGNVYTPGYCVKVELAGNRGFFHLVALSLISPLNWSCSRQDLGDKSEGGTHFARLQARTT